MKFSQKQQIVKDIDSGSKTLRQLGQEMGVTHQRISQIYYQMTGSGHKTLLKQRKTRTRNKKKEIKTKFLGEVHFSCQNCGKSVKRLEGQHLLKYCRECHKLSQDKKVALNVSLICVGCKISYHPKRNFLSVGRNKTKQKGKYGNFHSIICYQNRLEWESIRGRVEVAEELEEEQRLREKELAEQQRLEEAEQQKLAEGKKIFTLD